MYISYIRVLLLLLLIPNLVFALKQHECNNIHSRVAPEWQKHSELIELFTKLGPSENEMKLKLLQEASECCQRAVHHCDIILNNISRKSISEQNERWCISIKRKCDQDKTTLTTEITQLKIHIDNLLSILTFEKANNLYQKSESNIKLATAKIQACPVRRLSNTCEVVAVLKEVSKLYEEASLYSHEALKLVSNYPDEAGKSFLKKASAHFQEIANQYKKEAADWPIIIENQYNRLKEYLSSLNSDMKLFESKNLKRSCYELQKQILPILEKLVIDCLSEEEEIFKRELSNIKNAIALFEKDAGENRLANYTARVSNQDFLEKERERRKFFFESDMVLNPDICVCASLANEASTYAIALDGQISRNQKEFTQYTEQFYRYLVKNPTSISQIIIKIYENEKFLTEEKITLPFYNLLRWERHVATEGMVFVPETHIKTAFGIDLRFTFACDLLQPFSFIFAIKGYNPSHQIVISLNEQDTLCECSFSPPLPWQLETLCKPSIPLPNPCFDQSPFSKTTLMLDDEQKRLALNEKIQFPLLDKLVDQFKKDPLALAQFVQNEIAFVDPFLHQINGIYSAANIHKNASMTYLEKEGSAWEQCQLLIYLLRKAGYPAIYAVGEYCSLPKSIAEKMFSTQFPEDQKSILLQYPWVIFFDGSEWISLFPWMKELHAHEGYNIYSCLPEEYASADRFILRYLKNDENILKHIGPDGNDTAGLLFMRFIHEELRKQGLSLSDVGLHRTQIKKQFSSWQDFPHPSFQEGMNLYYCLEQEMPSIFARAHIAIRSHENPQKILSYNLTFANLNCTSIAIRCEDLENNQHRLYVQWGNSAEDYFFDLDQTDHHIDVEVHYIFNGTLDGGPAIKTLTMNKGTSAALCFHCGGASPLKTSQFYEQFSSEKDDKKRLHALLAYVGASYFEKCTQIEKDLAILHKINPLTVFAFGLAKLTPAISTKSFNKEEDLKLPQIDMFWFHADSSSPSVPYFWGQEINSAKRQYEALINVDGSSNEHQILREIFNDPYAISTVKLLQLSHQEQQKKGLSGEGFLTFTPTMFEVADRTPEMAQIAYFPNLKNLNIRNLRQIAPEQWSVIKNLLDDTKTINSTVYAYMTPGLTFSQNGVYQEIGTLIFGSSAQYALISSNNLLINGGLGSPLSNNFLSSQAIKEWKLIPSYNNYTLQAFPLINPPKSSLDLSLKSDVRSEHKNLFSMVADPVDIISGAFYIDETDLSLPGNFPLNIRRNYNSQNPILGAFGCGWKLSLNPYIIEQEGKLYAAEDDGTVITYSYNSETSRWIVIPEDNLDLSNFNQKGIGSVASPFHNYIENNILYGSNGSRRVIEDGLVIKWINAQGTTLSFSYNEKRLSYIESSNGDYCGIHYNHENQISEIYVKDGRRISYHYNAEGDLIRVALPNTAIVSYEYDRFHRVIREIKPHGRVLENIYDEQGRVIEQRSPMGFHQEMIVTAIFDYKDGMTIVTDAGGGKTTYNIFQNQIYKITDPLGYQTFQSWFIDNTSWFDAENACIKPWTAPGGFFRSLKSSIDKRGLITSYLYDSQGNAIEMSLGGKDLTGNGVSLITKKFLYNTNNLCIEESVSKQKTVTTYDIKFPYLPKKIEKYQDNVQLSYIALEYTDVGLVEKEDRSGSLTIWEYDLRGFPITKLQVTGTEDPNVITTYSYNNQGQCTVIKTSDSYKKNLYDIMGNLIRSQVFSLSGQLLSANYIGYNLNNDPIWKQTANTKNTIYIDYNASGLVKATRQNLCPTNKVAYSLYEYDSRGYLIEEVDPRGYCTYREYDALGKVLSETKEGHTTLFTYEPGGFTETMTSPSGSKIMRYYTTNGLLKEEIYPDDSINSFVYDAFGRPIQETKNGVIWEIQYDDIHHKMIRTHHATQDSEIHEFDVNGNLIRFTDASGATLEKTYDGLGRLKTEINSLGEQTRWFYQGNTVVCMQSNGEKTLSYYEGGQITSSEIFDKSNNIILRSSCHYDPESDLQEIIIGEQITRTWLNALKLPIKIEKGEVAINNEYDACGNCIISVDGEGRTTRQIFDGLGRLIQKNLPGEIICSYSYDADSNMTNYHLPSGVHWQATYDTMGRKTSEALLSEKQTTQHWNYTYQKGLLKKLEDPLGHIHSYTYDSYNRLICENVDDRERSFTYDNRGLLTSAQDNNSLINRSYDLLGRITSEDIFLEGSLIQHTEQNWSRAGRSLHIEDQDFDFTYQQGLLTKIETKQIVLSYAYDLGGRIIHRTTPFDSIDYTYNTSGLPITRTEQLLTTKSQETLSWDLSGKLLATSQKNYCYTPQGFLKKDSRDEYEFDFGKTGCGIRTKSSNWNVPHDSLDTFGRVTQEIYDNKLISSHYDAQGQIIQHGEKQLSWDSWGRLIEIKDPAFVWSASYDVLGRRLQTHFKPINGTNVTKTSIYDPENEFREIGIKQNSCTVWKIYGPQSCDALISDQEAVTLLHDTLGNLSSVVTSQTAYKISESSPYGTLEFSSQFDLITYAKSLSWQSKNLDLTGYIWLGARYYDSLGGRFLSPDPVSYPSCLDLYSYANGDPINYNDPDGRFASKVYQTQGSSILGSLQPFAIHLANAFTARLSDQGITRSQVYQVGSYNISNKKIGFINGINNSITESQANALSLSRNAQGTKIYGIYNASNSFSLDVLECGMGHLGIHSPPVQKLKKAWNDFIQESSTNAKYFQTCHSGGAIHVVNALLASPEAVRERIIVLAIAPGRIVPKKLCYQSFNYVSDRDIVPNFDILWNLKYRDELHVLEPHLNASFWDHDFLSPTFDDIKKYHILNYLEN